MSKLSLDDIMFKAEGESKMKKDTHPKYYRCTVTCVSCGNTFETGSTLKEIKVDTCANCHPFYTGKQRFVQSDGRVDRFNRKYGLNNERNKKKRIEGDAFFLFRGISKFVLTF